MLRTKNIMIGILLIMVMGAGITITQVQATLSNPGQLQRREANKMGSTANTAEIQEEESIAPVVDTNEITPQLILSPEGEVLQNFIALTEKNETRFLQPGWLHLVSQVDGDYDVPSDPLLNGEEIPQNYLWEEWMLVNDAGIVTQAVNLMLTLDRKLIQLTTLENGYWTNQTLGEISKAYPFKPGFAIGFREKLAKSIETGAIISQSPSTIEGQEVIRFVIGYDFGKPVKLGSFHQTVLSGESRAYVDPVTGEIRLLETIFTMEDGSTRTSTRTIPLKVEFGIEPPAEIMQYFEK
jgi:hypothetical protein